MKKVLIAIAGILALLIVAVGVLLAITDPNEYKPEIAKVVNDSTGRELQINGDIGWQLFPNFGLTLSNVTLSNPEGFKQPYMASLKELAVSVSVLPLLNGQLQVDGITIDEVRLNLTTLKNGRSNLDDISQNSETEEAPEAQSDQGSSSADLSQIALGQILIKDIQLLVDDQLAGTKQQVVLELFKLSQLKTGEKSDAELKLKLDTADLAAEVAINTSITISEAFDQIELHNLDILANLKGDSLPKGELTKKVSAKGDIQLTDLAVNLTDIELEVASLTGKGWLKFKQADVPELNFELNFDTFDLADFVPPATETDETTPSSEPPEADPNSEPDLSGLKAANVNGLITFKKVLAQGLTVENVSLKTALKDGILNAKPLTAQLYDGTFETNAQLNAQKAVASYSANIELKGVQMLPLIKDMADAELLAGITNFNMDIKGTGLSTNKLKTASVGKGSFQLSDGAVMGVNIPHKIRSIRATLKGDETPAEAKKTDFSSLNGSFTLAKGVVNNPDLKLASPLLRVDGKGSFDVVKTYVDYRAAAELVATSKGQGGKSGDDLAGIRIPLRVKGTPDDLSYKLDSESALKEEAKQKVEEKKEEAKDKLKEKIKGKLGNLFG